MLSEMQTLDWGLNRKKISMKSGNKRNVNLNRSLYLRAVQIQTYLMAKPRFKWAPRERSKVEAFPEMDKKVRV